eukprot:SAG11_NODE_18839_length_480_cov_0.795276_1_plen_62_part_10
MSRAGVAELAAEFADSSALLGAATAAREDLKPALLKAAQDLLLGMQAAGAAVRTLSLLRVA